MGSYDVQIIVKHLFIQSFIHSFIYYLYIHSIIHLFNHSFNLLFIHSFINFFIHSFINLFTHLLINLLQSSNIFISLRTRSSTSIFHQQTSHVRGGVSSVAVLSISSSLRRPESQYRRDHSQGSTRLFHRAFYACNTITARVPKNWSQPGFQRIDQSQGSKEHDHS